VRLPRDVSGRDLARALRVLGYETTRQTGSHIRLTTAQHGEHHVTIPDHDTLRVGTLSAILGDVAAHFGLARDDVVERVFGARR
jgi:predicted RNA binding protein YcfA (HicA-like mRNA interferase family)